MKELDYAWAAGFFDGEGSVTINVSKTGSRRLNPSYRLQITVTQVDIEPLIKLKNIFGGNWSTKIENNKLGKLPVSRWYLYGDDAARFLLVVRPYLVVKYKQADLGIYFQLNRRKHIHKLTEEDNKFGFECYNKMIVLNHPRVAMELV